MFLRLIKRGGAQCYCKTRHGRLISLRGLSFSEETGGVDGRKRGVAAEGLGGEDGQGEHNWAWEINQLINKKYLS